MATIIMMKNPQTGIIKKGFYGFSWTTFFFGGLPALFRGDIKTGILVLIACLLTGGVAGFIWAFFYNKYYTLKLVENGYQFLGDQQQILSAKAALSIANTSTPTPPTA